MNNTILPSKKIVSLTIIIALYSHCFSQTFDPNPTLTTAMKHLAKAQAATNKSSYPRSSNNDGTIKKVTASDWTSGFFPGSLWLMYENTKDVTWKTRAEQWTAALESQKNNTGTHDVGFILYSSFGAGYRLTGNETYKAILLQGAKSLSTRFNATVGSIKSWDNNPLYSFPVNIDNMMNLEILFWATKATGDSSYYNIALKHALTTMANHFRPDNSSYHVVDYNPSNGSIISKGTYQGLNDSSDWARGQAWGLYGFTMCYRETGDLRFFDMAKKIADFYISHPNMPPDDVPFWDLDAFDYRDASAACIASSALLELSQYGSQNANAYYNFAVNTLKTISSSTYTAVVGTNNNFLLKHSVGNKPKNTEVDKPLNFADYYCIEALLRHKKPAPILSALNGEAGQVTLKWNKATGATSYCIKRSMVSGGPYSLVDSNISNTTYLNSGLTGGQTYYYVITSRNATGEGEFSNEVNATPTAQQLNYTLTTAINGNGAIIKTPTQQGYTSGTTVSLKATPSSSQQFIGWSGNATGSINPLDIVMDADKSITANFAPTQYNLNITSNGNGTVSKIPNQNLYDSATIVTLTATPANGQEFTGWGEDTNSKNNPLAISMNTDKTITANFSLTTPLIINITNTTGRNYILTQLSVGTNVYSDRNYSATSVPSFLSNMPFIRTPNDDKASKSPAVFSFDLTQDATLYIAYDPRSTSIPGWLTSWQKLSSRIGVNDPNNTYMQLYSKDYAAGMVSIGGNMVSPAAGASSNYLLAAQKHLQLNLLSLNKYDGNISSVENNLSKDKSGLIEIKIYPNPNPGKKVYLQADNLASREILNFVIEDLAGNVIKKSRFISDAEGKLRKEMFLGNIAKGIYFINIKGNTLNTQMKLLIN